MRSSRPVLAGFLAALALPLAACGAAYAQDDVASAPTPAKKTAGKAKNVILFIGDGMGVSTVTAARIYAGQKQGLQGEEYVLPFETFPNVALVKTYNTNSQVPDSAGTATAMHSGKKTKIGFLGIGPGAPRGDCLAGQQHHLPLLGEQAKADDMAVGIVSTARITHATPASVYARSTDRNWESDKGIPEDQRRLGCRDIAQQLVDFPFDLALGGGLGAFYGPDKDGRRIREGDDLPAAWAARTGGTYVTDAAGLAAAPAGKPVLGLFSPSHMTYMAERKADSAEPTLTGMTAEAIKRLSTDPDGFYLMVESGRIDHGHHAGKAGFALEEAVEFARAIQWAIDNTDPEETLILVTADHSHVFTIAGYPVRGNPILGLVVQTDERGEPAGEPALAKDGKPYTTLGYANGPGAVVGEREMPETGVNARQQALVPTYSETHAGEDVALYASGPGSDKARGVIEQNRIYEIIVAALGWE
ncbi:alkaline phosphatase [Parerythrobacter jejuensis]|uniref:Alkaline phosphatase n=1 Tax=Parerythrobacter jejuensis TaxID=795812 RepID=A0A845AQK5_9SPHN|nr:alkaline phosphatase [Parerythrobacter jejuensis]MXP31151.1 alkaline phosphatase [Parerythrobacter jejuensis]MXP33911.1 alkaline phosphatase [Parerythrobacter jejuensis]